MPPYVPPGWPETVPPPSADGWEEAAIQWLFDLVPPAYRQHDVLRDYPAALVAVAWHHVKACHDGTLDGYRRVRTDLSAHIPPHAIDDVLDAYRQEGIRLKAARSGISLVGRAL